MGMSLIGLEKLRRKLNRIPESVRRRAQADLMLAGRQINMAQRALAPSDDGDLRASIRSEPLTDGTIGVVIRAGGPTTTKPVRNGQSATYDYALGQEYGTQDMAPNAFFWPAYKAGKGKARRDVRAGVKRSLRQAVTGS
jgi:HK97 gp10 family phage protein